MNPHKYVRSAVNAAASLFGVRVVSADWGPRGVRETLRRVKARGFSPTLVFDVGASNGQWTRECRSVFEEARYVLIDPLENNRAALTRLAAEDQRIRVFFGVAGANPGTSRLHEHGDQSSVLSSEAFPGVLKTVDATTVDSLFRSQGGCAPVLLKADVQGYELEVLKGASHCLESTEMLILEVSFRKIYKDSALADEIIAYLGARGFRIYEICSYMQGSKGRDLIQSDFVFVHESSSLLGDPAAA